MRIDARKSLRGARDSRLPRHGFATIHPEWFTSDKIPFAAACVLRYEYR
jgi:hypothetical protein